MRAILFILVALAAAQNIPERLLLSSPNPEYRKLVRLQNQRAVEAHNSIAKRSFSMKLYEKFSILTQEEREAIYLIPQVHLQKLFFNRVVKEGPSLLERTFASENIHVNWTDRGKVTQVKDQGYCGSCYAYAAIGDIESTYLFRGVSVDLSQQQIIDCSGRFGNYGCDGGWMMNVFDYVKLNGVANAATYPDSLQSYENGTAGQCRLIPRQKTYRIRSAHYTSNYINDCSSLTRIVRSRPVTVAVAVNFDFFFYYEGVFNLCDQYPQINHAVQLTGLSQSEESNYWMAKNSWSEYWGNYGYINIDRSQYNHCAICFAPSYSTL